MRIAVTGASGRIGGEVVRLTGRPPTPVRTILARR